MNREREHNRECWDALVDQANEWTIPFDSEAIADARRGQLQLLLTPCKPVPEDWYPPLQGTPTLCLATGGGQQAPALAAAGAMVRSPWTPAGPPAETAPGVEDLVLDSRRMEPLGCRRSSTLSVRS